MSLFPEEPANSPAGYFPAWLNQTLNNRRWTIILKLESDDSWNCDPNNILLSSYQQGPDVCEFLSKYPSNSGKEVTDSQGKAHHVVRLQPLNKFELSRESPATDFARITSQSENIILDPPSTFLPPGALIDGAESDTNADILMLGCTIYTLHQKVYFPKSSQKSEITATKAMSGKEAEATASVIKACLKFNPAEKPTAYAFL